jgi:citrate synthase
LIGSINPARRGIVAPVEDDKPLTDWMTAEDAARALGVTRSTLYAYVSRGLVRSKAAPGTTQRRYRRDEIQRLAHERERARKPALVAQASLDWGRPVLDSALTLIQAGRLYYRGRDAVDLARTASLEDVAALLWDADIDALSAAPVPRAAPAALRALATRPAPERCLAAFAWLQSIDEPQATPSAEAMRLLRLMTAVAGGRAATRAPVHAQLARAWALDARGADLLRRALVLCADHELNASGFAARCVASTKASLGACVTAGLAALSGDRHCGVTTAIEGLWDRTRGVRAPRLARAIGQRLAEGGVPGQRLPGFGHLLYPDGDPRAIALLDALPARDRHPALLAAVLERLGERPSVDYALVALCRHLGLPDGSAYSLFALGRTVGWIAHALEQQRGDTLIRPRANYTGPRPTAAMSALEALPSRVVRRR